MLAGTNRELETTTASSAEEEAELCRLTCAEKNLWIDKYEQLLTDHQGLADSYNRILKELERESDAIDSIEIKPDPNDSFFIEQELLRGYSSRKNAEDRLKLVDIRPKGEDKNPQVTGLEQHIPAVAELIRNRDAQISQLQTEVAGLTGENQQLRAKLSESDAKILFFEQEMNRCRLV